MNNIFLKIVISITTDLNNLCLSLQSILNQNFNDYIIIILDSNNIIEKQMPESDIKKIINKNSSKIDILKNNSDTFLKNFSINYKCVSEYIWFINSNIKLEDNVLSYFYDEAKRNICDIYNINLMHDLQGCGLTFESEYKIIKTTKCQKFQIDKNIEYIEYVLQHILQHNIKNIKIYSIKNTFFTYIDNNKKCNSLCKYSEKVKYIIEYLQKLPQTKYIEDNIFKLSFYFGNNIEKPYLQIKANTYIDNRYLLMETKKKKLDIFDIPAYVVTIDDNRFIKCKKILQSIGINNINKTYSAIDDHNIGCKIGHLYSILNFLNNSDKDYCLIFEDDAYPCENCNEELLKLQESINSFPTNIDCLFLGVYGQPIEYINTLPEIIEKINAKFYQNSAFYTCKTITHGTHSYILSKTGARIFLHLICSHYYKYTCLDEVLFTGFSNNLITPYITTKLFFCQHDIDSNIYRYPLYYNTLKMQIGIHVDTNIPPFDAKIN